MFKTYVGPDEQRKTTCRLSPPGNRAGDFRAVQKCAGNVAPESAVRHRAGRQGVPQRSHAAQLHLPLARVRADGTGIFHQARRGHRSHQRPRGDGGGNRKSEIGNRKSRIGAGKRGTNTGSRNASSFTKASACRATRWSSIGRRRRNWRITPAPAWTFCSSSRSASATKTAS